MPKKIQYSTFLLRISFGCILFTHGIYKLLTLFSSFNVMIYQALGFSSLTIYSILTLEIVCGFIIMLGAYMRLMTTLTLPILAMAVWIHAKNGFFFSALGGGWEFPALLFMLAIILLLQGAGALAVRKIPIIDKLIPEVFK